MDCIHLPTQNSLNKNCEHLWSFEGIKDNIKCGTYDP
jgi:hypothetical protein